MKTIVFFVMSVFVILVPAFTNITLAAQKTEPEIVNGNVPATFIPGSKITFGSDGNYEITKIESQSDMSSDQGQEIGKNLADDNPEAFEKAHQELRKKFDNLPVYTYEQYYIAKEGAVALYDTNGELIRVEGVCEYYSTLNQYMVNGFLPDGKYVGTYLTFSQITGDLDGSDNSRATTSSISQSGSFTTFGDKWPGCNTNPVPNDPNYGDRVCDENNKLHVGDAALKSSGGIPYNAMIGVIVEPSDTNGNGHIGRSMRVRDTMNENSNSVLDIWRWDNPEWVYGTPQSPNNVYLGQKYSTGCCFPNKENLWIYRK